ncbi:MAG: hypothetical protein GX774_19810 [Armatimonadetes bacterium]|jgi:hypothetical protein|nr:hypothetical protein [Armatimonadota bacterium]
MKLRNEDLSLAARKALVARLLRTRFEAGAIAEYEYLILQGRIEQVATREALDAIQAEVEGI